MTIPTFLSKLSRGSRGVRVTKEDIRKWNLGLGAAYLVQAIVILVWGVSKPMPVMSSYLTKDAIASSVGGQTVLATAVRRVFDADILYLLAAALIVAGLSHVWFAWKGRQRYDRAVSARVNGYRWLALGVIGALLSVSVALLAGVDLLSSLMAIILFTSGAAFMGYLTEQRGAAQQGLARRPFRLGIAAAAGAWLMSALSLAGSRLYGTDTPLYVCILFWSATILTGLLIATLYIAQKQRGNWRNQRYAERAYLLAEFGLIVAIVWQIFVGALRP